MKLKATKEVNVRIEMDGEIVLEQYCDLLDEVVPIYLTLDQFRVINRWVSRNQFDIDKAWNYGVQDES